MTVGEVSESDTDTWYKKLKKTCHVAALYPGLLKQTNSKLNTAAKLRVNVLCSAAGNIACGNAKNTPQSQNILRNVV